MTTGNGLFSSIVDSWGLIRDGEWRRAATRGDFVGPCDMPGCGGFLVPRHPEAVGRILWYEALCSSCQHTYAAPNGRVLPRSSRHDEMPPGRLAQLQVRWVELFGKKKEQAA